MTCNTLNEMLLAAPFSELFQTVNMTGNTIGDTSSHTNEDNMTGSTGNHNGFSSDKIENDDGVFGNNTGPTWDHKKWGITASSRIDGNPSSVQNDVSSDCSTEFLISSANHQPQMWGNTWTDQPNKSTCNTSCIITVGEKNRMLPSTGRIAQSDGIPFNQGNNTGSMTKNSTLESKGCQPSQTAITSNVNITWVDDFDIETKYRTFDGQSASATVGQCGAELVTNRSYRKTGDCSANIMNISVRSRNDKLCLDYRPVINYTGSQTRHGLIETGSTGGDTGSTACHIPVTNMAGTCTSHGPLISSTGSCASHGAVTTTTSIINHCRPLMSIVLLLLVQTLAMPVTGRDLTKEDITDIERFTEHVRQCHGVTALSLSVVQGDRAVITKGFGHSDLSKGTKATAKTPFCIGSVTKAFTSTLLAMQIAKNKNGVDWDTPLHCFPDSDISFSDDIRSSQTSLRDLLSHRLGIPGYFGVLRVGYPGNTTRKDIAQRMPFMQPTRPFRSAMLYNNFLYGLAGYAAELLADRAATWEELTRAAIFNPAGMTSSGFIDKTHEPPGLALPYAYVNGTTYQVDTAITKTVGPLGPAGSIYSTAEDMARWIQLHLAVLSKKEVPFPGTLSLDQNAVQQIGETYQPQIPEPPFAQSLIRPMFPVDDVPLSYAMGWGRGIYRGYRKLFHSGGISTYVSLIQLLPDMKSGIFLSTSGGQGSSIVTRLVASYITDKIIDEAHWFNDSTACTFPAPWAAATVEQYKEAEEGGRKDGAKEEKPVPTFVPPIPAHTNLNPLTAFPGTYGHYAFGTIHVYAQVGTLYARYGRFGHYLLEPTSVVGFYLGYFLDKLWYLSNQDTQRSISKFQFTDIDNGQAYHLLLPIDGGAQPVTFIRGLDVNSPPPPVRRYPGLYSCPAPLNSAANKLSLHSLSRVGATILAYLSFFVILEWSTF